jgi:hypothetical protein
MTSPRATAAPAIAPTLIKMVRARFCFAGASAAPAGFDAAKPVVVAVSAAAVPTGFWFPSFCDCGSDWAAPVWPAAF